MNDMTDFWARHASEWQKPGALVRDPVTGAAFRHGVHWQPDDNDTVNLKFKLTDSKFGHAKLRAIAAGPVLDDDAMRGILLAWFRRASGDSIACVWFDDYYYGSGYGWTWRYKETSRCQCDSEIDALLEALRWALELPDSPAREVTNGD